MSKTLRDLNLIDLCTQSINYDRQVQSACQAFDAQMWEIIDDTGPPDASVPPSPSPTTPITEPPITPQAYITFIPLIMSIADSTLVDILAWQFHVDFYDPTADLETRKQLVQNSIQWHMRKGTVALLQDVLNFFFPGGATLQEWYDYMDPLPPNFPIDDHDEIRAVVRPADVNPSQDRIQLNNAHFAEGEAVFWVVVAGGTLPAPFVAGTTYYIKNYTTTHFQFAATIGGAVVDITTSGVGTNELWHKGLPGGSWHDRYRFRALIDVHIIPPEKEAMALALINEYKPVSRWFDGFYEALISTCDIAWYGAMLEFFYVTSEAPDYTPIES